MKYVIFLLIFFINKIITTTCTDGIPLKDDMPFCGDVVNFPIDADLDIAKADTKIKDFYDKFLSIAKANKVVLNNRCYDVIKTYYCYSNVMFTHCYNEKLYPACINICHKIDELGCSDFWGGSQCDINKTYDSSEHCASMNISTPSSSFSFFKW